MRPGPSPALFQRARSVSVSAAVDLTSSPMASRGRPGRKSRLAWFYRNLKQRSHGQLSLSISRRPTSAGRRAAMLTEEPSRALDYVNCDSHRPNGILLSREREASWTCMTATDERIGVRWLPAPALHPLRRDAPARASCSARRNIPRPRSSPRRRARRAPEIVTVSLRRELARLKEGQDFWRLIREHRRARAAQHRRLLQRQGGGDDGRRWRAKCSARPGSSSK